MRSYEWLSTGPRAQTQASRILAIMPSCQGGGPKPAGGPVAISKLSGWSWSPLGSELCALDGVLLDAGSCPVALCVVPSQHLYLETGSYFDDV